MSGKKLNHAEALLRDARRNPSRMCRDPRQLDLDDFVMSQAFAQLDKSIKAALEESHPEFSATPGEELVSRSN